MKPLVSVIVPVYKVEDCLVRCLDSLCRQKLHVIEIILVDDASPDRCGEICETYATRDARFKVIHHPENRGLSAARNTGIHIATADYLMFVDSDDWVHEDFCKLPYECAVRYQADVVLFNYMSAKDLPVISDDKNDTGLYAQKNGYRKHVEAIDLIHSRVGQAAWNKLYKSALFDDISYPEGFLCEDWGTTYKLVLKSKRIFYLDQCFYYYYVLRPGSISSHKTKKSLHDWIVLAVQQYRDLLNWGYPKDKLDLFLLQIAIMYCIQKKRDADDPYYVFLEERIKTCEKIPDEFSWKKKFLFVILKHNPSLFELICSLFGKKLK